MLSLVDHVAGGCHVRHVLSVRCRHTPVQGHPGPHRTVGGRPADTVANGPCSSRSGTPDLRSTGMCMFQVTGLRVMIMKTNSGKPACEMCFVIDRCVGLQYTCTYWLCVRLGERPPTGQDVKELRGGRRCVLHQITRGLPCGLGERKLSGVGAGPL